MSDYELKLCKMNISIAIAAKRPTRTRKLCTNNRSAVTKHFLIYMSFSKDLAFRRKNIGIETNTIYIFTLFQLFVLLFPSYPH